MSLQEVDGLMWCTTHHEPIDEANDNICRGGWDDDCNIVPLYIIPADATLAALEAENDRLRRNLQAICGGGE